MTEFHTPPEEPVISGADLIGLYGKEVRARSASNFISDEEQQFGRALMVSVEVHDEAKVFGMRWPLERQIGSLIAGPLHGRLVVATAINPGDFIQVDTAESMHVQADRPLPPIDFTTWGKAKAADSPTVEPVGVSEISGVIENHNDADVSFPVATDNMSPIRYGKLGIMIASDSGVPKHCLIKVVDPDGQPLIKLQILDAEPAIEQVTKVQL